MINTILIVFHTYNVSVPCTVKSSKSNTYIRILSSYPAKIVTQYSMVYKTYNRPIFDTVIIGVGYYFIVDEGPIETHTSSWSETNYRVIALTRPPTVDTGTFHMYDLLVIYQGSGPPIIAKISHINSKCDNVITSTLHYGKILTHRPLSAAIKLNRHWIYGMNDSTLHFKENSGMYVSMLYLGKKHTKVVLYILHNQFNSQLNSRQCTLRNWRNWFRNFHDYHQPLW